MQVLGKKNMAVNRLMARILVYSAIKISANVPLLYSVLNPETSSDSPSAKSNGVRLVSARMLVNQQRRRGGRRMAGGVGLLLGRRLRDRAVPIMRGVRRIRVILTS